jgi:exonuclease SbcC
MQSSPENLELLTRLQATLAGMMEGASFTKEVLTAGSLPVVLMQRPHALAAFALGDQEDYRPLYEAFKKHYLKNSAHWSTKDLAFVYCIPGQIEVDPNFCSRVEVDVYFCRKYAIRLNDTLEASLARLPFLPLAPISPGVQIRPPSAQTLLRQRNLKAELAKSLVVPQVSSASNILTACISGKYGDPSPLASAVEPAATSVAKEERVQATIKSISIQNFRAYRTKKQFDLGTAVTVLYGPNGFGKTSFFDAIDFVVTGGVGRLKKATGGIAQAAKHLDCTDEVTEVSLTLVREGKEHVITRNLADLNYATVNGKVTQRKDVLSLLTGGTAPSADRVDGMVDLFRATHLFSQENQELTRDVASECKLSSDLVSKMLAFEDYANGLKKAEEVLKLAIQQHAAAVEDASKARQNIELERAEIERLQVMAAVDMSSSALDARFAAIEEAISAAGFDISAYEIRDTRAVRATLESAATQAAARRGTLSRAVDQVGALLALRSQLEPIHAQLTERQATLKKAEATESEFLERLNKLSTSLAQLKAQERALQNRLDWLDWAISVRPEYTHLTAQIQEMSTGLTALTDQITSNRATLGQTQELQRQASSTLQTAEAALKASSDTRARVLSVKDMGTFWDQSEPKRSELLADLAKSEATIESLRGQRDGAHAAAQAQQLQLDKAERALNETKTSQSQVKALVVELRNHVEGPTCQLCGHDHASTDALFKAIDRRLAQDERVVQLSEAASKERTSLQSLQGQVQIAVERVALEERKQTALLAQQARFSQQLANYEVSLSTLGLALTSETPQKLQTLSKQVQGSELLAATAIGSAKQSTAAADAAVAGARATLQASQQQHQAAEGALHSVRHRLNALQADANRGSLNLAAPSQELVEIRGSTAADLASMSLLAIGTNNEVEREKASHAAAKASVTAARASHQLASQTWTTHQTRVQSVLSELAVAQFDSSVTPEELREQMEVATAREVSALSLRDRMSEIEVAVDTATTSAALQSIRQRITVNEQVLQQATARAQSLEPWVAYFAGVTKLLSTQQALATDHFIEEYGPRTAVIQQRLRPVYGFGGIEVTSKDKSISVSVQRNGVRLRPTDYFSQSQIQTLVLGLFLTACSSQTWSGFSSIMMDDPVTHFDDLNTYALLDLILGLQSSEEGERQFVISTCDEKLLQLARHKFRHMGEAAKFYRFQAIGSDGPMVSEISA